MLFGIQYRKEDGRLFEVEYAVDAESEKSGWEAAHEEARRLTEENGTEYWVDGMIVWQEEVPDEQMNFFEGIVSNGPSKLH